MDVLASHLKTDTPEFAANRARMTALVGPARAKRLAALCEKVDAPTALNWGLADAVAEDGQALARAHARSGSASAIAGYLGKSDAFERAIEAFLAHARTHRHDTAESVLARWPEATELLR